MYLFGENKLICLLQPQIELYWFYIPIFWTCKHEIHQYIVAFKLVSINQLKGALSNFCSNLGQLKLSPWNAAVNLSHKVLFIYQLSSLREYLATEEMMLLQVSETMSAANSHNGHLANMDEVDEKPMLIVKKTGDGPGITALINRQLQGTLTQS